MRTKEDIIREIEEASGTKLIISNLIIGLFEVYKFNEEGTKYSVFKIWFSRRWKKCCLFTCKEYEYFNTTRNLKLLVELMEVLENE